MFRFTRKPSSEGTVST